MSAGRLIAVIVVSWCAASVLTAFLYHRIKCAYQARYQRREGSR